MPKDQQSLSRVLVVEDTKEIAAMLASLLERQGYEVRVEDNGGRAMASIYDYQPHIVLLDIMLPAKDGMEILKELRGDESLSDVVVIMLTARSSQQDIVEGLELGADDYVAKPFSPPELLARISANTRRISQKEALVFLGLELRPKRHQVFVDNEERSFTLTEYLILQFFFSSRGSILTRDQIINQVKGDKIYIVDRNIDVHISAIRKKISPYQNCIKTVRGIGYRFDVSEES